MNNILNKIKCWLGYHKQSIWWSNVKLEWCDSALWEFTECDKCKRLINMVKWSDENEQV